MHLLVWFGRPPRPRSPRRLLSQRGVVSEATTERRGQRDRDRDRKSQQYSADAATNAIAGPWSATLACTSCRLDCAKATCHAILGSYPPSVTCRPTAAADNALGSEFAPSGEQVAACTFWAKCAAHATWVGPSPVHVGVSMYTCKHVYRMYLSRPPRPPKHAHVLFCRLVTLAVAVVAAVVVPRNTLVHFVRWLTLWRRRDRDRGCMSHCNPTSWTPVDFP